MNRDSNSSGKWEAFCEKNILPRIKSLGKYRLVKDYENQKVLGTDAILNTFLGKRFVRVDFKWNEVFKYDTILFPLEDSDYKDDSWLWNNSAVEKGVVIIHPWRVREGSDIYHFSAYDLKALQNIARIKKRGCSLQSFGDSGKGWLLTEEELKNSCVCCLLWESEWVDLTELRDIWRRENEK